MKALEVIASRRMEASRVNRGRWDLMRMVIVIVTVVSVVSLCVSFWIFFDSETELEEPHVPLQSSLLGQVHPFYLSSADEINSKLKQTKSTTFVYSEIPAECKHESSANKNLFSWIQDVSAPADISDDNHWSLVSRTLLVPVTSTDCIGKVLSIMDTDPLTAGQRIIWITGNMRGNIRESILTHHYTYPGSFATLPSEGVADVKKTDGKFWQMNNPKDDMTTIQYSEFCEYNHVDANLFVLFVANNCMPVVPNRKLVDSFPFPKLVKWNSVILMFENGINDNAKKSLKTSPTQAHALSSVSNLLKGLSAEQMFLYNIAFSK